MLFTDAVLLSAVAVLKNGLTEEGIFRLSGSSSELQQLVDDYNSGKRPDLCDVGDVNVVTGFLKQFLRQLPEPLFTPEDIAELRATRWLLGALFHRISLASDATRMTTQALAIVLSPTLQITTSECEESIEREYSLETAPPDVPQIFISTLSAVSL